MSPPFRGDSKEDLAIIAYAKDSGVPHVVTATTNHSLKTTSGNISRHVQQGTDGKGLAVDFAGPSGGHDTKELEAIWAVFHGIGAQLYELIYAGHQCIKNGQPYKYPNNVLSGHHNHVHVSVNKGVFLQWQSPLLPAGWTENLRIEVDMQVATVDVTIDTDHEGNGWLKVPYPVDHIIGHLGPGLRPAADGHYGGAEVGFAPENNGTIVSVTDWFANSQAVVRIRVAA